jgi:hypothetical protein
VGSGLVSDETMCTMQQNTHSHSIWTVALALCPLGSNTLIHGSADAGQTILSDPEAENKLRIAASCLNLKVTLVCLCE